MASWQETPPSLRRWFRRHQPPPATPYSITGTLDTSTRRLFRLFGHQEGPRVAVDCYHCVSQWGTFGGAGAWVPYLRLNFTKAARLHRANMTFKVASGEENIVPGSSPEAEGDAHRERNTTTQQSTHLEPPSMERVVPVEIWGGVSLREERERAYELSPTVGVGGFEANIGSVSDRKMRQFENVLKKSSLWTLKGQTRALDNTASFPQLAEWELKVEGNDAKIPNDIRMGLIVRYHKGDVESPARSFKATVGIEGILHERLLGDYEFVGNSDTFTVTLGKSGGVDFTEWTNSMMREDMIRKGWQPIESVDVEAQVPVL